MKTTFSNCKLTTCLLLAMPAIITMELRAQDYLISFTGAGASTTVDSVMVENLMQVSTLKVKGSEVLRLTVVTGIEAKA